MIQAANELFREESIEEVENVIDLQDLIYDIDESCLLDFRNTILSGDYIKSLFKTKQFLRNILQCTSLRPNTCKPLAKLCYYLYRAKETNPDLINIKPFLYKYLTKHSDLKPGNFLFYRFAVSEGLFSALEIVSAFIDRDRPSNISNISLPFQWFAPEFESSCKTFFLRYIIENSKNTDNHFIPRIDQFRNNNWDLFFKTIEHQQIPGTIEYAIATDNLSEFQRFSSEPGFQYDNIISPSIFDTLFYNEIPPTYIQFAAFNSSINIFKFLQVNNVKLSRIKEQFPYMNNIPQKLTKPQVENMKRHHLRRNIEENQRLIEENPYSVAKYMVELEAMQNNEDEKTQQVEALLRARLQQKRLMREYNKTIVAKTRRRVRYSKKVKSYMRDTTNYQALSEKLAKRIIENFGFPFIGNAFPPQVNPLTNEIIMPATEEQVLVEEKKNELKPIQEVKFFEKSRLLELYSKLYPPPKPEASKIVPTRYKSRNDYEMNEYDDSDEDNEYDYESEQTTTTPTFNLLDEFYNAPQFAIAGGNSEIVRILQQKQAKFSHCFRIAAAFHQNSTFKWLYGILEQPKKNNIFEAAVEYGNVEIIRYLVEQGYNPNVINQYGNTALFSAIYRKQLDSFIALLSIKTVDFNFLSKTGDRPIFVAIRSNDQEIMQKLLSIPSIDVNVLDRFGNSPLMLAIQNDFNKIAQMIVSHPSLKLDSTVTTSRYSRIASDTMFHYLMGHSSIEVMKSILERKDVDPNIVDKMGRTPLLLAIEKKNEEMVKLLLEHPKVDVNKSTMALRRTETPLTLAIKTNFPAIKHLIDHPNIDLNLSNNLVDKEIPLFLAYKQKNMEVVFMLLDKPGIDVNIVDKNNYSILHNATQIGNSTLVRKLLSIKDINPNIQSINGLTPLMQSIDDTTQLLLAHPAIDPNIVDLQGCNAAMWAANNNNNRGLQSLIEDGRIDVLKRDKYGRNVFLIAAEAQDLNILKTVINYKGNDINIVDESGQNALHHAALKKRPQNVLFLLGVPNIDIWAKDKATRTPFHLSAIFLPNSPTSKFETAACFEIFLKMGDEHMNDRDINGDTPLHLLVMSSRATKEHFITAEGKHFYSMSSNNRKKNYLISAIEADNLDLALHLINRYPALVNMQDCDGNTALHHAASKGYNELIIAMTKMRSTNANILNNRKQTFSMLAIMSKKQVNASMLRRTASMTPRYMTTRQEDTQEDDDDVQFIGSRTISH